MKNPYHQQVGKDGKHYVDGPCPGGECSYYGGTLYGNYRFPSRDTAEIAAKIANIAFSQGYKHAQAQIRKALGAKAA